MTRYPLIPPLPTSKVTLLLFLLLLLAKDASSSSPPNSNSNSNGNSNSNSNSNSHPTPTTVHQFHVESSVLPSKRHQLYHDVSSPLDDPNHDSFRGGAASSSQAPSSKDKGTAAAASIPPSLPLQVVATTKKRNSTATWISASLATLILSMAVYIHRETLAPYLLDKHYIQERTLQILQDLQQKPGALYLYMLGMATWELLGLSTIPVETAAGMVFGLQTGFLASGGGKLLGAFTAFGIGRYLLAGVVQTRLDENPVWKTLNKSTHVHSPMKVALLMKFSCFPEMIKNFGSSCLQELSFVTFAVATMIHGLLFTFVWTYLGVDTANRLEAAPELLPINWRLQTSLIAAAIAGLVVSPLLMAWWIRDMKRRATTDDSTTSSFSSSNGKKK